MRQFAEMKYAGWTDEQAYRQTNRPSEKGRTDGRTEGHNLLIISSGFIVMFNKNVFSITGCALCRFNLKAVKARKALA